MHACIIISCLWNLSKTVNKQCGHHRWSFISYPYLNMIIVKPENEYLKTLSPTRKLGSDHRKMSKMTNPKTAIRSR